MSKTAPIIAFPKEKEEIERQVRLLYNQLIVAEGITKNENSQMYFDFRFLSIIQERLSQRILNFRNRHCGIPCSQCSEQEHCQIGVYSKEIV